MKTLKLLQFKSELLEPTDDEVTDVFYGEM